MTTTTLNETFIKEIETITNVLNDEQRASELNRLVMMEHFKLCAKKDINTLDHDIYKIELPYGIWVAQRADDGMRDISIFGHKMPIALYSYDNIDDVNVFLVCNNKDDYYTFEISFPNNNYYTGKFTHNSIIDFLDSSNDYNAYAIDYLRSKLHTDNNFKTISDDELSKMLDDDDLWLNDNN